MPCQRVQMPGGGVAMVCGSRPRAKLCACGSGERARLQCDWKVAERQAGTCDAFICQDCTTVPAPDKDLCQSHAAAWVRWRTARNALESE